MKKLILLVMLSTALFFWSSAGFAKPAMPYFQKGQAKYFAGDFSGAIEDYNKAIKLDPKGVPMFYLFRGNAKGNLDDYSGALKDYNTAIKLNPKYAFVFYMRGLAKSKLGDDQGAQKDLSKAESLGFTKEQEMRIRGKLQGQ